MDPLDPAFQCKVVSRVSLYSLLLFLSVQYYFFLGALIPAISKEMREKGWFKFNHEKQEQE